MAGRKRLTRRIQQIRRRHPHHWKNAVWAWANRGEGNLRRRIRRFRAYLVYARNVEEWLRKKHPDEWRDHIKEMNAIKDSVGRKLAILEKRYRRRRREREDDDDHPTGGSCWGSLDGRSVPQWMVPWIQKIRAAGWDGYVVSGVRTPAYSEQLCYSMCGAPACPGRCAGRASNHNCTSCCYPEGAIDVSDYIEFAYLARKLGAPFHNGLPATDPVHFSASGV